MAVAVMDFGLISGALEWSKLYLGEPHPLRVCVHTKGNVKSEMILAIRWIRRIFVDQHYFFHFTTFWNLYRNFPQLELPVFCYYSVKLS